MISAISFLCVLAVEVSAVAPILHLRADTGVVLDASGAVKLWKDLSPRATDFGTRGTAASDSATRPLPTSAGLNGRASVRFDGMQVLVDTSFLPLDSAFTAFIVAQDLDTAARSTLLGKTKNDVTISLWGDAVGNFNLSQSWVAAMAKTDLQSAEPMLYEVSWNGSEARLFMAGRLVARSAYASSLTRTKATYLGANWGNGSWQGFLDGHIGEVLVYPGQIPGSDRIAIEDSLLARWGIDRMGMFVESAVQGAPDPILHLRADSGIVLDPAGGVKQWNDLSYRKASYGTSAREIPLDSSNRPTSAEKGLNGKRSVRFSGRSALVDTSSLPLHKGFTAFIVAQDSNPDGFTSLLGKGRNDLTICLWGTDAGNFNLSVAWMKLIAKTQEQTIEPMLYEASWSGSEGRIYMAGRLEGAGVLDTTITNNPTTLVGANFDGATMQGYLTGHVGEVLVYPSVLSDTLRWEIEDGLLARWSIARLGRSKQTDNTVGVQSRDPVGSMPRVMAGENAWRIADGRAARAELRAPDGRILSSSRFSSGEAVLPLHRGVAVLSLVDPDGRARTRLLLSPR